jgi:hypothetical protein
VRWPAPGKKDVVARRSPSDGEGSGFQRRRFNDGRRRRCFDLREREEGVSGGRRGGRTTAMAASYRERAEMAFGPGGGRRRGGFYTGNTATGERRPGQPIGARCAATEPLPGGPHRAAVFFIVNKPLNSFSV